MSDDRRAEHDNHQENPDLNLNQAMVRINVVPSAVRITAFGSHYSGLLNIDIGQMTRKFRRLHDDWVKMLFLTIGGAQC